MSIIKKIDYYELINVDKKIKHPFERNILTGNAKPNIGKGKFIWHDMGNGLATSIGKYSLYEDTLVSFCSDVVGAVIIFNLGESFTHVFKDNKKYLIKKNSFFIGISSTDFCVQMDQKKNKNYETISLGMKVELFIELADNFKDAYKKINEAKENSYAIIEGGEIDPIQFELLNSLKKKDICENLLNTFYYESKTTTLLHYTIEKISKTIDKIADLNLNINTINSLEKAKNIILNEYYKPLSIKQIAYKSAINECYLKKDFKAYYDMTIYEMIQKQRLDVAKELLQKDFSVKDVALNVGYKHVGHFSKLFNEYFSISPSQYKKTFR